jgi:hypothetical protein
MCIYVHVSIKYIFGSQHLLVETQPSGLTTQRVYFQRIKMSTSPKGKKIQIKSLQVYFQPNTKGESQGMKMSR